MRIFILVLVLGCQLSPVSASAAEGVDTRHLMLVSDSHANLTLSGVRYILESYIVPFGPPYHIKVVRWDNQPMDKSTAVEVARKYIRPRSCTDPFERRPELDEKSADRTEWLIGIDC